MTKTTISPPAPPKLAIHLDDWQGSTARDVEIEERLVHGADFTEVRKLELDGCGVTSAMLTGAKVDKLRCSDAKLTHIEAAGMSAPEAQLLRTVIKDSRMTGVDLGAAFLEDCTFEAVKFNEAGLRYATLKRVVFKDCAFKAADFSGAKLSHVSFEGCDLAGTSFDRAECKNVDMRSENLSTIKGVSGLKGVRVSEEQLIELAPLMALELGLHVGNIE